MHLYGGTGWLGRRSASACAHHCTSVIVQPGASRLIQDLRYAARTLRRSPGFAVAAILSMALGIGSNTAIFSLVHTLLLRPLPVHAPEQLVEPISWLPDSDAPRANAFAWKHFIHFRDHAHAFSSLIAVSPVRLQAGNQTEPPESINAEFVVGPFFEFLGIEPARGRLLGPGDDRAESDGAAVISWQYWQRRLNGDPGVVGRPLVLNGERATIVGVAPRSFFGLQVGLSPDVWLPLAMEPRTQRPSRLVDGSLIVRVIGRLRPGVSRAQAQAEMRVLDQQRIEDLVKLAPFWRHVQLLVEPAATGFAGPRELFAGPLLLLMVVTAVLLLIACANVATLSVARASARQREIAVRVAIGAGRGPIIRQLLAESLLLSAIGGALGVVFAILCGNLLVRMLLSGRLPPGFPAQFDVRVQADPVVLLFTAGAVLLAAVLCTLAPVRHVWSVRPIAAMRATAGGDDPPDRRRFGRGLVTAQVALSIALLGAAGLLRGHLSHLKSDTGFDRERVLLVTLDPSRSGPERARLFVPYRTVIERLESMPGVDAVTVSAVTPVEGPGAARMIDVDGFHEAPEAKKYIPLNFVGPRYFETYRTRLIAGREFRFDDIGRPRVAIVNQALARYYFGASDPIGRHFTFSGREGVYEIVGLVADAKYQQLTDVAPRTIYVHAFQEPRMFTDKLSIRTTRRETAMAPEVQRLVAEVLTPGAVTKVTTLERQLDASIAIERTIATLSVFIGVLGALLAALGLYGLLAFSIARRRREIGIRIALGATSADVVRLVLRGAMLLVAAGVIAGAPVAFWGQRVAAHVLPGFTVDAWWPVAMAAAQMMLVALAASYIPARRASQVDPAVALKQD
ncbi:MAG TPA: ABC transporter permease [Vicinamibacterales bacterium]|nr:ABC transporter permease [Vicinamibacterales bacterium]